MMLLFCNSACCVYLKYNTGGRKYLDVVLMSFSWFSLAMTCFIFVGNPDELSVFLLLAGLYLRSVFNHIYVYSVVFPGICVPLYVVFSDEKLSGFVVELDGKCFLYFSFVLILK